MAPVFVFFYSIIIVYHLCYVVSDVGLCFKCKFLLVFARIYRCYNIFGLGILNCFLYVSIAKEQMTHIKYNLSIKYVVILSI